MKRLERMDCEFAVCFPRLFQFGDERANDVFEVERVPDRNFVIAGTVETGWNNCSC